MLTHVEKCSGGLAIVVPATLASQVGLTDGGPADVKLAGDRLIVRASTPLTLADLLAGVTPENIHAEWAPGPPVGKELL